MQQDYPKLTLQHTEEKQRIEALIEPQLDMPATIEKDKNESC